eukprot:2275609-Amphidinium_carterae.1
MLFAQIARRQTFLLLIKSRVESGDTVHRDQSVHIGKATACQASLFFCSISCSADTVNFACAHSLAASVCAKPTEMSPRHLVEI